METHRNAPTGQHQRQATELWTLKLNTMKTWKPQKTTRNQLHDMDLDTSDDLAYSDPGRADTDWHVETRLRSRIHPTEVLLAQVNTTQDASRNQLDTSGKPSNPSQTLILPYPLPGQHNQATTLSSGPQPHPHHSCYPSEASILPTTQTITGTTSSVQFTETNIHPGYIYSQ